MRSAPIKAKISACHRYNEERPEKKKVIETNAKMNNYKNEAFVLHCVTTSLYWYNGEHILEVPNLN